MKICDGSLFFFKIFSAYAVTPDLSSTMLATSHAEPTLFLTKDQKVQVRAHTTRKGKLFFCVSDFVRNALVEEISKDDAVRLWIDITLLNMDTEYHIRNNRMVLFAGPYELKTPCLGAEGLMFMYYYMGHNLKMALKENIRSEVQDVLQEVAMGHNIDAHVRMHDDGEITEQLAGMAEKPYLYPPPVSPYKFLNSVKDSDGNQMPLQSFIDIKEKTEKMLLSSVATLEKRNEELMAQLQSHNEQLLELESFKASEDRKRKRRDGFCVKDLIVEEKLEVTEDDAFALCKAVTNSFKQHFPEGETFTKLGKTFYYPEDMDAVKALVVHEYRKLLIGAVDSEPVERGVGTVFSDSV